MRLFLILFLSSCTTHRHQNLFEQELRFRQGYEGLTNQICTKEFLGICLSRGVLEYRFDKPDVVQRLREVELVCKVGEKRFRICDGGLCTTDLVPLKVVMGIPWKWEIRILEKIEIPKNVQRLIDAGAYCAALGSITELEME